MALPSLAAPGSLPLNRGREIVGSKGDQKSVLFIFTRFPVDVKSLSCNVVLLGYIVKVMVKHRRKISIVHLSESSGKSRWEDICCFPVSAHVLRVYF